ncbi:type II toxin-antitoxin system PemK/MazF family toxin [uncultured Flavonifractor sp.]|uniref:type II toxin-antitoxin system PemK/MazF family toxin n=1 Tax=uncultured Flavonifractor sp. TaxID=1193534 RepID=UPI002592105C|nr:type II toxin-antitoxin system PemK/MazF family toxin [uncultured Flavonifractor sp.]
MVTIFEQGDIVYLDFDPQSGHEQKGRRPALVISNNLFNRVSSLTMVCPITHTDRGHPFHLRLDERTRTDRVILCDQARMLDLNSRHASFVERAPEDISSEAVDMVIGFLEPK